MLCLLPLFLFYRINQILCECQQPNHDDHYLDQNYDARMPTERSSEWDKRTYYNDGNQKKKITFHLLPAGQLISMLPVVLRIPSVCFQQVENSFPLNRARRLGGHIVHHTVDSADFVHDAAGDAFQNFIRERHPVGGHPVF